MRRKKVTNTVAKIRIMRGTIQIGVITPGYDSIAVPRKGEHIQIGESQRFAVVGVDHKYHTDGLLETIVRVTP